MSSKQTGKGKGATHKKRHEKQKGESVIRDLKLADKSFDESYGIVKEELGGCQFIVEDSDGRSVRATISKGWRQGPNRERVDKGNTVVIGPGISSNQFHIIHQYSSSEVAILHSRGLIKKPKSDKEIDVNDLSEIIKFEEAAEEVAEDNQDNDDTYDINDL